MVSTRRNKKSPYAVGDKVEVTRPSGTVVMGTLLSKQKRQRNNAQWKVSIGDVGSMLIKETKLGRILTPTTTPQESSPPSVPVSGSDVSIMTTQQQQRVDASTPLSKPATSRKPVASRKELQQAGLTTRGGLTVRKTVMKTGILFIYTKTRRAEFVRTK